MNYFFRINNATMTDNAPITIWMYGVPPVRFVSQPYIRGTNNNSPLNSSSHGAYFVMSFMVLPPL